MKLGKQEVFLRDYERCVNSHGKARVLSVAVLRPTGAVEVITNHAHLNQKMDYYMSAYDENMRLKVNPEIQIIGWMVV